MKTISSAPNGTELRAIVEAAANQDSTANPSVVSHTDQRKNVHNAAIIRTPGGNSCFGDHQEDYASEAIHQQYKFLASIIDSISQPFYVIDTKTYQINLANPTAASGRKWQGQTCHAIIHNRPEPCNGQDCLCPLEMIQRTGKPVTVEHIRPGDEGRKICYEVHAYPIFDRNGDVSQIIEYCIDISGRKRLERELLETKTMEATALLAGGIAHDFNNLLTAILGYITLAKRRLLPIDPIGDFLDRAIEATRQATRLTRKFSSFSQGCQPIKESCRVAELLEQSVEKTRHNPAVTLAVSCPESVWPVNVDRGLVYHALLNIITNAEESMPAGGIIEIACENVELNSLERDFTPAPPENRKQCVRITIRDQGIGIAEEQLPMVFAPYYSSKELGCRKGMGMGLTTAYSIIKKHDGHISLDSRPGQGTTVRIYLPANHAGDRSIAGL